MTIEYGPVLKPVSYNPKAYYLHIFDQDQQRLNRIYPDEKDLTLHRVIGQIRYSEYSLNSVCLV